MLAVEFQAEIIDGRMDISLAVRERLSEEVHGILFTEGADHDWSVWPKQNRRRWELIAKKRCQGLTDIATKEIIRARAMSCSFLRSAKTQRIKARCSVVSGWAGF